MEELKSSRVQEDVISRAEIKVKELENALRTEERSVRTLQTLFCHEASVKCVCLCILSVSSFYHMCL